MLLSDIAVKRPTLAIVANALLLVFGILAFTNLPLRQYPDVDPPIVGIDVTYRGASAEIVDTKVTRLLEDQLSGIEAIRYIDSVSSDGAARITIEFEIERDVEAAVNDVQQAIGRVMPQLPAEIDAPRVRKADANANPIMWFNLTSDRLNELELSDYARRVIVDRLSVVDGVALVIVGGEREYAMRLYLDRRKLAARQLTVTDVEDALRAENVELPAGRIQSDWRNFSARISRIYQSPEDFARLVIKRGDDGHLVRLGEVADISLAAADDENLFRRDGVSMIGLGIVKQSQANTVEVAERARAEVARINPLLPEGMTIERSGDTSVFIAAAIEEVYTTLAIAMVMVVLVIYLFLGNVRATLIPAITVPISLVASFIFVALMGFSINILTLLALVLAIGLVVDDSIVMLENIYSRIEQGEPPMLAAY
ncbi:MAG: efflux RND transporter permease subunit, partial [Porticoccaceae bacterium]